MAVPPIRPSVMVALLGGYGVPDKEESPVGHITAAHLALDLFFIAVLLLAIWAIGDTIASAEDPDAH